MQAEILRAKAELRCLIKLKLKTLGEHSGGRTLRESLCG
jgi:hypothetical protein